MIEPLFEKQKKKTTVDVVIESIWQLLLTKKLRPGQKMPSEGEIAEGLGVSRGSVREAMKILSAFGIVEIKVGDGTYIPAEPKSATIEPLLFNFLLYNPDLKELSEFRRLIEMDVIDLIIRHKEDNQEERQLLEENLAELQALKSARADADAYAKNDMAFHRLLGRACCNRLTQRVYDFVLDYFENSIRSTHYNQVRGTVAYEVHTCIIDAIRANDLEVARAAIARSVEIWQDLQTPARL